MRSNIWNCFVGCRPWFSTQTRKKGYFKAFHILIVLAFGVSCIKECRKTQLTFHPLRHFCRSREIVLKSAIVYVPLHGYHQKTTNSYVKWRPTKNKVILTCIQEVVTQIHIIAIIRHLNTVWRTLSYCCEIHFVLAHDVVKTVCPGKKTFCRLIWSKTL